jgi:predicted membrane protein
MNNFFEKCLPAIIIIAVCALIQILVGITWWIVLLVSVFLVGITWLRSNYKYRSVGTFLLWIVIATWIFYVIKVEILQQEFPITNLVKDRTQENNDVELANFINPNMVETKKALLSTLLKRQKKFGQQIDSAYYNNDDALADSLLKQQFDITKKILSVRDEILNFEKNYKNHQQTENQETQSSNETLVGKVSDNTTAYFRADRPFSIILSLDKQANYTVQEMPAGRSSFTFDNGGYVRVVGSGRTDIKME